MGEKALLDMSERTGTCNSCGQRYGGIPDSVTALKVKCRECDGEVIIPPLPDPEPAVAPEAKPEAKEVAESKDKTKRPGKAKPVNRIVAGAPVPKPVVPPKPIVPPKKAVVPPKPVVPPKKAVVPPKPVVPPKKAVVPPKPVAPPVVKPVEAPKPAAKPVDPPKPPAEPSEPVASEPVAVPEAPKKLTAAEIIAKAKAKRAAEADATTPQEPAPKKPSAAEIIAKAKAKRAADATASSPAPAKAAPAPAAKAAVPGARRRRPAPRTSGSSSYRPVDSKKIKKNDGPRRFAEDKPKKSHPIIMVAVLLVIAGAAWGSMELLKDKIESAPNQPAVASNDAQPETTAETALAQPGNAPTASVLEEAAPAAMVLEETAPTDDSGTADPTSTPDSSTPSAPAAKPEVAFEAPEAGFAINYKGITDPTKLDLKAVAPLPRWAQCSEEKWAEVKDDLNLYLEDAGLQSNRAGRRLVEDYAREAFPAIVNAMLKGDFFSREGMREVGALNNLLTKMGKGQNFGWESLGQNEFGSEAANTAIMFNKKIACIWHNMWLGKLSKDDNQWRAFTKTKVAEKKEEDPMEAAPDYDDDPFDD